MSATGKTYPLIDYLLTKAKAEDRATLAALRRGLGQPPGTAPDMYPHVVPFVTRYNEETCYLIAALFGLHPASTAQGNMGTHYRSLARELGEDSAVERRFTHLLRSRREDLDDPLRQAVSLLKSKGISVNWHQLMGDILNWDHPSSFVQRQWVGQFWNEARTTASESEDAKSN